MFGFEVMLRGDVVSPGVPTVTLTHVFTKEGDQFVSYCMELGTSSCGDTIEEAFDNIKEAVEVHLTALEQMGEMERSPKALFATS